MRLTILLFFIALVHASASSFAQNISIHLNHVPLKDALHEIEQKSGYVFLYEAKIVSDQKVTIDRKDATIDEVLRDCLQNLPVDYKVVGKNIILQQKQLPLQQVRGGQGPPADVIGRVTNNAGQPLEGAYVIVKRLQSGVLTDANGVFKLSGIYPTDTLYVSFVGYARGIIRVGDETNLKIVLNEATNNLDQVVIQAYGETTQRLATGDIGTVSSKEIARQPVTNVLEALQGQVAGTVVTNQSGYASASVKVEIRGRNSIGNYPSDPLYIIDGVPLTIQDLQSRDTYTGGTQGVIQSGIGSPAGGQSPFFSINPQDIESISVLKDADATAIYGSRGANGVILITTKKGKAGKMHTEINVYEGAESVPTNSFKLLNTQQYVAMREEALRNDGLPLNINTAPDLVAWDTTRYTDWQKYAFSGVGRATDADLSLSGGDEQTTFRLSGGYHYTTDITTVSGANQRGSFSFNLDHKSLNKKLDIAFSGIYTLTSTDQIGILPSSVLLPPNAPAIFDDRGNLNFNGWSPLDGNFIFNGLEQPYTANTNYLNSNLVVSYKLTKNLSFKTNFGYGNIQTRQSFYFPIASQDPVYDPTGSSELGYTTVRNLIVEPQLTYNTIISKGKLDAFAGISSQDNLTSSALLTGSGYTSDILLHAISAAPIPFAANSEGEYKYAAVFGRVNYSWEDKYILNLNVRRDGSSRFGPGRQFGNFGSIGTAWIFTEEPWLKRKLPFLSFGKIRASYGTTGGDQISNYAYLSKWTFGTDLYNRVVPVLPIGHTDSLIHWQVNKKLEASIDVGVLEDRINLNVSWYRNRVSDQLVPFPTPTFTGFSLVTANSPAEVQNAGWEFSINGKIVDGKDFKWSSNFNLGINRNMLISYPNLSQSPYAGVFIIGQPLNIVRVLHYTGVDPQTGLYTFQDKNHDGQITFDQSGRTLDDTYTIDLSPKFSGGWTNNFSYRNWSLSCFFYYKKQMGRNAYASLDPPGDVTNQALDVYLNAWHKPGDIAQFAKFTTNASDISYTNYQQSDAIITDASFIRLQNVALSYALSDALTKKLGVGHCSVFFKAENLFVLTKYKGSDPEIQIFGVLPVPRIVTTGISCNF